MNYVKVKLEKEEVQGTMVDVVFEVSRCLEAMAPYEVSNTYNKKILNCKNDLERLKVINSYISVE